jgi:hypothetical protein
MEYYGLAVAEIRVQGRQVEDEVLAHISPAHSENVNLFGTIAVDVERELAKLDPSGYRPLRERNSAPPRRPRARQPLGTHPARRRLRPRQSRPLPPRPHRR